MKVLQGESFGHVRVRRLTLEFDEGERALVQDKRASHGSMRIRVGMGVKEETEEIPWIGYPS